jgi:hypothetical protein
MTPVGIQEWVQVLLTALRLFRLHCTVCAESNPVRRGIARFDPFRKESNKMRMRRQSLARKRTNQTVYKMRLESMKCLQDTGYQIR